MDKAADDKRQMRTVSSSWGSRSDRPAKGFDRAVRLCCLLAPAGGCVLVLLAPPSSVRAFSALRRLIATKPISRKPPVPGSKTGDYVDIRYQDHVCYRKPVGIYWMQAAVVGPGECVGAAQCGHHHLASAFCRAPSLIGALGAALATYWCALAFVSLSRRGIVGFDDGRSLLFVCVEGWLRRKPTPCRSAPSFSP